MNVELANIARVRPNKPVCQWLQAHSKSESEELPTDDRRVLAVPHLMPGVVIFVHGVNSIGEWYRNAAMQISRGLNTRLGRQCLDAPEYSEVTRRLLQTSTSGQRLRSPVIPFYWGYKLVAGDLRRYPGIFHEEDGAWGGGPFQNGTNNLLQFWQGGFERKLLNKVVDLQLLNTDITRQLLDAPPRAYFIHAAKRLANLVDTIREDFPDEPLNIIAHSQGNMITLCAMLYVKQRAPDTLILTSAPYSFEAKITDWLAAAHGWSDVQSGAARINTFEAVAKKIADAKTNYRPQQTSAECPKQESADATSVYVQRPPRRSGWERDIGSGPVNDAGQRWFESELHVRDNRGKIFVNFDPQDRVIGISAIEGIGWRGVPEPLIGESSSRFPNVFQRAFARNSGLKELPAVGARCGYWFRYIYAQHVLKDVESDYGTKIVTSDGTPLRTESDDLQTFDGKEPSKFWGKAPEKILGLFGVQSTPSPFEKVWINAPCVPFPAVLPDNFEQGLAKFDGSDGDLEQQAEFEVFSRHYVLPNPTGDDEADAAARRAQLERLGKQLVPKTNHGQILMWGQRGGEAGLVEHVISYDLTVGQGYAFGDPNYWDYLLTLADWTLSDPYYFTGKLPDPGPFPDGLDPDTVGASLGI